MPAFPPLKTGAVAQYPASKSLIHSGRVLQFLDGAGQRYREYKTPLHKWIIHLEMLGEDELAILEQFFITQEGQFGIFSFTDPWTELEYASCSIDDAAFEIRLTGENRGSGKIVVVENRT